MTDTARPAPQHDTLVTVALVLAVVATLGHVAQAGPRAALPAIALGAGGAGSVVGVAELLLPPIIGAILARPRRTARAERTHRHRPGAPGRVQARSAPRPEEPP